MKSATPTVEFVVQIIVEPDEGGFHAYCPALKGVHVDGETEEEALQNARDAAIAYLRSLIKHGEPIPIGVAPSKARRRGQSSVRAHVEKLHIDNLADLPPFYVPVLMRGQCPCWASSKEGDAEGIAVAPQNNFANSFGVRLPRLL